jgi:phage-related protein
VYAVRPGEELWVVHAFQKKSTQGIKTPRHEVDLAKERLKRLKEQVK